MGFTGAPLGIIPHCRGLGIQVFLGFHEKNAGYNIAPAFSANGANRRLAPLYNNIRYNIINTKTHK